MSEAETPVATPSNVPAEQIKRNISMKDFGGKTYLNKNVVAKGEGTKLLLGYIAGYVTGCDRKTNTTPDGSEQTSTVLIGQFQLQRVEDGEIISATSAYLPAAYALQIEATLKSDADIKIEFDVEVSAQYNAKSATSYEYIVRNLSARRAPSPLDRILAERKSRMAAIQAPEKQAQIVAPVATPEPSAEEKPHAEAVKEKSKAK
jgi:hypothetical protein